jgi:hypothetical protein
MYLPGVHFLECQGQPFGKQLHESGKPFAKRNGDLVSKGAQLLKLNAM